MNPFSISMLGRGLVLIALLLATTGSFAGYLAGSRRDRRAWLYARNAAYGFSASMIGANLLMIYALVTKDFSVKYVTQVGSLATPPLISVVSLWSSLEGSILFWGGILGVYVALTVWSLGEKHKEFAPWALHVLLAISVFFAFLIASVADPFHYVPNPPMDGPGPNPLLQNHWLMAVHPPMLYLGYVGMSVPFSLICAALLAGRFESGWMGPVRNWMLIPWTFLSFGIMLGGWWSYAVLGWGGAWAWDPVENASFHPWLTGTAFLHSAMVLQRRGRMRDWTLVLGMATFLLTLLGTFMTRSGVFNSVHSFTQSSIGPVFLVFIAVVFLYSVLLLAFRSHLLDEEAEQVAQSIGTRGGGGGRSILSREIAIAVQNVLFAMFAFTVLLGTLFPLIVEWTQGRQLSVGEPYFDRWGLPLGLGITFMMGVGPALPWGRHDPAAATRRLGPAVVVGIVFAGFWGALGYTKPFTLLALFTIGFALWANLHEFVEPVWARMKARQEPMHLAMSRVFVRARRRFGGHTAHYGVLFAVFALALTKGYRAEKDFTMTVGETVDFDSYQVTYAGYENVDEGFRTAEVANFHVVRNGREVGTFGPRMNHYPTQMQPIVTPAIHERPTGDLYFSLIDIGTNNGGQKVVVRMIHQPYQMWLWFSAPIIALGTLISLWPERERGRSASRSPAPHVVAGSAK
ncbi:MAG: heme lyase CcmF/NrfE family subunit [Myxococcota bacterium]